MRDWLTAFRPASFRGVGFKVDGEDLSGGRRLAINPIAYADQSVIEDMGRDPLGFAIAAYVAGDAADGQAKTLTAALLIKGAGALVLPMHGPVNVRVASFRRNRQKDVAGYVAFDIEFIEAGLASVPFAGISGAGGLAALLTGATLAAGLIRTFAGLADAQSSPDIEHARQAGMQARLIVSAAMAGEVMPADMEAALAGLDAAGQKAASAPDEYAGALANAWRLAGMRADAAALQDGLAIDLAAPLSGKAAIASRVGMAAAYAVAMVRTDYPAQADAAAAREALRLVTGPVLIEAAALGDDAAVFVADITGRAAMMVSVGQASRAPLVAVETDLSISAIRAAYDLYGDAGRAGELLSRNGLGDPVFLPVRFEALGI